jgi:putative membrane protein
LWRIGGIVETGAAVTQKPDANALAVERTDWALERTFMAADRTLMAWVRTAISMIGFGFTLYKFLQYLHQQKPEGMPSLEGPRNLGLAFIGLGLLSLVIAVIQDWHYTKRLQGEHHRRPFNLSLVVAGLVALIGVFTFTSVLLHVGPF